MTIPAVLAIFKAMTKLESQIKVAQDAYYNKTPIMSDAEFDELWDTLMREQPDSELLRSVGSDHTDGFTKVKHRILMGSQSKANTAEDMDAFYVRNAPFRSFIRQLKLDGCSIAMEYDDGKFYEAKTRGDGEYGDDITSNALKMTGLIKKLTLPPVSGTDPFTGTIRGEVLLPKSVKEKHFPDMKNCRNAASGIMKHLDGKDCDKLRIMVYDAQFTDRGKSFDTQTDIMNWLERCGFSVAPWEEVQAEETGKNAIAHIDWIFKPEERAKLDYDIDGVVYKRDRIDPEDFRTNYRPKSTIALKPKFTTARSVLRDIDWQVKNGTVTPVAVFDPVDLEGSTVTRASMANIAMMEYLGLEIGHEILVIKANMIIPKIIKDITTGKSLGNYME